MTKKQQQPAAVLEGMSVPYTLNANDARLMNDQRPRGKKRLEAGQSVRMTVTYDHKGDCVDGIVKADGTELTVERRNRGYGVGNWDWPSAGIEDG